MEKLPTFPPHAGRPDPRRESSRLPLVLFQHRIQVPEDAALDASAPRVLFEVTGPDHSPDAGAGAKPDAEPDAEPNAEPDPAPDPESNSEPDSDADAEPDADADANANASPYVNGPVMRQTGVRKTFVDLEGQSFLCNEVLIGREDRATG